MVAKHLIKIKEQSKVVMMEAEKCANLFDDAFRMAIYQEFENGHVITWEELNVVKIGGVLPLPSSTNGKIEYERQINENKKTLNYTAYFSPESILPRHQHDCREIIFVEQGSFSVLLGTENEGTLRTILLNKGEIIDVKPNEPHQFTNTHKGDTIIKIKYLKPMG